MPLRHQLEVSIHAPLAGRDRITASPASAAGEFQSTRPSRGATRFRPSRAKRKRGFQSTRPSRGATLSPVSPLACSSGFNPRAPRGARPVPLCGTARVYLFQSTRPSRGATLSWERSSSIQRVSIHAPLAGRDGTRSAQRPLPACFNPRAPRGARRRLMVPVRPTCLFQSTRPSRGATRLSDGTC